MPTQRLLTNTETAGFLLRHPLVAEYIGKTKLAIVSGVYDWTQSLPDWFFGMIPPWGMQVEDSTYGNVVVYFGPDGTLYLSAYTDVIAGIDDPRYIPPPHKCKDGSDAVLGFCPEDFDLSGLYLVGFAVAAFVGYQMFFAKK